MSRCSAPGTSGDTPPLCGRVSVTLEHPGLWPPLGLLIRRPLQTDQEVIRLPRRHTQGITSGLPDLIIPPALFCLSRLFQAILQLAPRFFWGKLLPSSAPTGSPTRLPFYRSPSHSTLPLLQQIISITRSICLPNMCPSSCSWATAKPLQSRVLGQNAFSNKEAFGVQAASTVQAQSSFTFPGGREMPTLPQPSCEAHSRCYWTTGAESQLSFPSQLFVPLLSKHKESQDNGGSFIRWWWWWSFIHRRKNWRTATWLPMSVGCAPQR